MTDIPAIAPTTGITGATGIASGLGKLATKDNLAKAGQQFEAVFTGMMMKAMRAAKLAEPLFDSQAIDTFREMQDQKVVQQMAEHTPLGIGKAMTDFLARGLTAAPEPHQPAPPPGLPLSVSLMGGRVGERAGAAPDSATPKQKASSQPDLNQDSIKPAP